MADANLTAQLDAAEKRIETLLMVALGADHPAIDDWAVIRFAIRDAKRYRAGNGDAAQKSDGNQAS